MDHAFNLQAIVGKMRKNKPAKHRLYLFFCGITKSLSVEEIKEMKFAAGKEYKRFISHLDKAIIENSKQKHTTI